MIHLPRFLIAAMLLTAVSVSPAFAMGDTLSEAIKKYHAGKINEALQLLNCAQYDVSRAAEAHYYKGCILAKLGAHADAVREFKLAKLLDHSGTYAPLAAQALQGYGESTQTDRAQTQAMQASAPPPPKRLATPQQVEYTAKRISNQASERISRVWTEARLPQKDLPPWMSPGYSRPSSRIPTFDTSRYRLYDPNYVRNSSWTGSREYEYHRQRAKGVAESADGLVSQLTREDDGKGVFLVPHGTNLYVRNYEFGTSIDPPLLAKRTEMKMWSLKERVPAGVLESVNASSQPSPLATATLDSAAAPAVEAAKPTMSLPTQEESLQTEEAASVQRDAVQIDPTVRHQQNAEAIEKYGTP